MYYRCKRLSDMTREELIAAVEDLTLLMARAQRDALQRAEFTRRVAERMGHL